jgi:hypothetical protein
MAFAGERYRIGIATRGFRGGSGGENVYITETVELTDVSSEVNVAVAQDIVNLTINPDSELSVNIFYETIEVDIEEID